MLMLESGKGRVLLAHFGFDSFFDFEWLQPWLMLCVGGEFKFVHDRKIGGLA